MKKKEAEKWRHWCFLSQMDMLCGFDRNRVKQGRWVANLLGSLLHKLSYKHGWRSIGVNSDSGSETRKSNSWGRRRSQDLCFEITDEAESERGEREREKREEMWKKAVDRFQFLSWSNETSLVVFNGQSEPRWGTRGAWLGESHKLLRRKIFDPHFDFPFTHSLQSCQRCKGQITFNKMTKLNPHDTWHDMTSYRHVKMKNTCVYNIKMIKWSLQQVPSNEGYNN